MNLSSVSINRPVLAIVMSLIIILFGGIGYTFLGVREYPSIDPPVITVKTSYSGANADVIESQITEPLEKSINGIEGVRTITSSSSFVITAESICWAIIRWVPHNNNAKITHDLFID